MEIVCNQEVFIEERKGLKNINTVEFQNVPVEIEMLPDGKLEVLTKDVIRKGKKIINRRNVFDTYKIDVSEDEHFIYLNITGSGRTELITDGAKWKYVMLENSTIPFRVLPEYEIVKTLSQ